MAEAAELAMGFVENRGRRDLETDAQLRLAVLRALEVLGEAASKVSPELRSAHPQVPWREMGNMRNRLIHAYFDIDLDVVWETVTQSVPKVLAQLEKVLDPERET